MMRVCVIGNSHFGAIKRGWDSSKDLANRMQLTFFGTPASMLETLQVGDGCLYDANENVSRYLSVTSGGLRTIEAQLYDLFVIVSLELSFAIATDFYLRHRLPEHHAPDLQLISRSALESGLLGALRSTLAATTYGKLRRITGAPVVFITAPLPNPAVQRHPRYHMYWNGNHLPFLLNLYNAKFAEFATELDAAAYTQPAQTFAAPCFTDPSYALDQEISGLTHTNAKFGEALLRDIVPLLESLFARKQGQENGPVRA